ncbi:hypothetical protein SEA_LILYPAD_5 [Gordonia phage LilyPad]|nr:hypothetical protein SEA_LILYPAD_5 [Gordonia phage LilyPad]
MARKRRGAWGNALGGYRRQKRDGRGRFSRNASAVAARKKYKGQRKAIKRQARRDIWDNRTAPYRRNTRKGFKMIAAAHGANIKGRQLTRDMKFSSKVMIHSTKINRKRDLKALRTKYKTAKRNSRQGRMISQGSYMGDSRGRQVKNGKYLYSGASYERLSRKNRVVRF